MTTSDELDDVVGPTALTPGPDVAHRRRLVVAGVVGYFMLGLAAAVLGPSLPELRSRFHVDVQHGALALTANSACAVLGVLISGWAQHTRRPRPTFVGGSIAMGVGALALAVAPSWPVVLVGAGLVGIGFGVLDFGVTVVLATSFAASGASVLTFLSAVFSIGAVLGPVVVGASPDGVWPVFALLAILAGVLAALWLRIPGSSLLSLPAVRTPGRRRFAVKVAVSFGVLFALYVCLENGVGSWETTYLRDAAGFTQSSAAGAVSLFWVSLTVGRLVGGWVAKYVSTVTLLQGSIVGAAASLVLAGLPGLGLVGFTATGLFLAPIFPAAWSWFASTRPTPIAMTAVFASAVLGPALSSPVIGAATEQFGPAAIPFALVVIALLEILALVAARRVLENGS